MHITIKAYPNKAFSVEIEPFDDIKNLRAKLADKEGIEISGQRLLFEGNQLLDEMTVSHYNIQNESTIHLVKRKSNMVVFIKCLNGMTRAVDADLYDLVGEIKTEVQDKTYRENLKLVFDGKILDDNKTLSYYHIKDESTLYMALCSFAYMS